MSSYKNGILLLTRIPGKILLYGVLQEVSKYIQKNLYVEILNNSHLHKANQKPNLSISKLQELISIIYNRPADMCRDVDVHVLLPEAKSCLNSQKRCLSRVPNVCIAVEDLKSMSSDLEAFIKSRYLLQDFCMKYIDMPNEDSVGSENVCSHNTYPGVVIGGTFDHIHDGHKLLISTALLFTDEKITVGVADGPLLQKKILKELIEPTNARIKNVVQMVEEYKPGLKHKVVPIIDPCGPSGTDDDLQLLVVSEETLSGGPVVNAARKSNGLQALDVSSIELVGESPTDLSENLNAEEKLSSSAERVRQLGLIRREPNIKKMENRCYVIGVTGGIASGKSAVVKRLERLGAYTINCDKLGHVAYLPGQKAYNSIINHFGKEILHEDGTVNRKKLGPIVFGDSEKLKLLNSIVWPEIHTMKQEIIRKVEAEGNHDIVVFEGAVLFESGWDKDANEVWCCVISNDETVKRIQTRDGLSEEHAKSRLASQMTNQERVDRSHVILSTLWEPEFTQKQVEKAWKLLCERIGVDIKTFSSL